MICDVCKQRPSLIVVQEIRGSTINELNLCLSCASNYGFKPTKEQSDGGVFDLLSGIVGSLQHAHDIALKNLSALSCPVCGLTGSELVEGGITGCRNCFSVFDKIIDHNIISYNKTLHYMGRLPDGLGKMKENRIKIRTLKKELKEHVIYERYKEAATIRDQINKLKGVSKTIK